MMKRLFLLLLVLVPLCAFSQRKEISQAKAFVKSGNELPKAEEMMRNLLKDSLNRTNDKIWLILFDAIKKQYDQGNEQLYLKNKYDTAQLFNAARKMYLVLESFDSVDAKPNKNGKVTLKYRKKHADFLDSYRPNLYSGGFFFSRRRDYAQAYNMFDTYIDCVRQPLFSSYEYQEKDKKLPRAAYMALFCGYKQQDTAKTLKYVDLAMKDTAMLPRIYQYLASTYALIGDTVKYREMLQSGFANYPRVMFFFSNLFDLYYKQGNMEKSLLLCDDALRTDSANNVFKFAKSSVLLNIGRFDECISISDELIAQNDTLADAYLNAGLAYYNQAVRIGSGTVLSRSQKTRLMFLYKSAMPYIQRYRILAPENKDKWAVPLYTIYLNLNMGKEFDEIDALLNKQDDGNK